MATGETRGSVARALIARALISAQLTIFRARGSIKRRTSGRNRAKRNGSQFFLSYVTTSARRRIVVVRPVRARVHARSDGAGIKINDANPKFSFLFPPLGGITTVRARHGTFVRDAGANRWISFIPSRIPRVYPPTISRYPSFPVS